MLRWITRAALFRFLPRRALPILAAVDLFLLFRGLRRKQPVNEPTASRTAQPPPLPRPSTKR